VGRTDPNATRTGSPAAHDRPRTDGRPLLSTSPVGLSKTAAGGTGNGGKRGDLDPRGQVPEPGAVGAGATIRPRRCCSLSPGPRAASPGTVRSRTPLRLATTCKTPRRVPCRYARRPSSWLNFGRRRSRSIGPQKLTGPRVEERPGPANPGPSAAERPLGSTTGGTDPNPSFAALPPCPQRVMTLGLAVQDVAARCQASRVTHLHGLLDGHLARFQTHEVDRLAPRFPTANLSPVGGTEAARRRPWDNRFRSRPEGSRAGGSSIRWRTPLPAVRAEGQAALCFGGSEDGLLLAQLHTPRCLALSAPLRVGVDRGKEAAVGAEEHGSPPPGLSRPGSGSSTNIPVALDLANAAAPARRPGRSSPTGGRRRPRHSLRCPAHCWVTAGRRGEFCR